MQQRSPHFVSLPLLCLVGVAVLSLTGCHRRAADEHELDMAKEGTVRIVSRQIEKTDRHVHWKWSLIGERNWRKASASGTDLTLADTYPLNDPSNRGGCNIWECDLEAERTDTAVNWTATLHGSDGDTATTKGTIPASGTGDIDASVPILLDQDSTPKLPAEVRLASLGDKPLILHVAQ